MVILSHFAPGVKVYSKLLELLGSGEVVELGRVRKCPRCGASGRCIKWGSYPRWALWLTGAIPIRVQRYRCKACGRTHGSVPSFCSPGFTYGVPLLGHALERYFEKGLSCEQIVEEIRESWSGHTLVVASVRRWVKGFCAEAEARLTAVNRSLLEQSTSKSAVVDRPVDRGDRRRVGALVLRALEALRLASEGGTLGRGFRARRFEFYHLWLFRKYGSGLVG
jgi:hypothetical protein